MNDALTPLSTMLIGFSAIVLITLFQVISTKKSVLFSLLGFLGFCLIFKFGGDNFLPLLGVYTIALCAPLTVLLLKKDLLTENFLPVFLTVFGSYAAVSLLDTMSFLPAEVVSKRLLLLMVVILVGLAFSFVVNVLNSEGTSILNRLGALAVKLLVIFLILHNFLDINLHVIFFAMSFYAFMQVLDIASIKLNNHKESQVLNKIFMVGFILIGGFIATRVFGTFGLALLALASLSTLSYDPQKKINWPLIAGVFFAIKVIVQAFMATHSLNATGLNLTHPYVYVGLLIGIFLPFIAGAFIIEYSKKFYGLPYLVPFVAALVIPATLAYIIQIPASGAMIFGMSASGIVIASLASIYAVLKEHKDYIMLGSGIIPLGALSGMVLMLSDKLLEAGDVATRLQRAEAFLLVTILTIILLFVIQKGSKKLLEQTN